MNDYNIKLTPLLSFGENRAVCNLLSIDDLNILFDCGWDETFNSEVLKVYENLINTKIKYIFLSNNTIHHVGGLPYLLKGDRFKDTEIYTTTPISKLGFYIILDAVISKLDVEEFLHFNDTDITEAFLRLKELNYDQKVKLNHNHTEILISPVSSGYSIGGCAWKIIYNRKTIIYAPQISIDSKNICDPFKYELMKHPFLFITESKVSNPNQITRYAVEKKFKSCLINTIKTGKNIFIPSDSSNFSLEIIIIIEKIMSEYYTKAKEENFQVQPYRILFCNYCSNEIIDDVKTQIEWMCSEISKQFYNFNENPFSFQYLLCVNDIHQFNELKKTNHIIVASTESLDLGFSNKILCEILTNFNYEIYLFNKGNPSSLLRKLISSIKNKIPVFSYNEVIRKIDSQQVNYSNVNSNYINEVAIPIDIKKEDSKQYAVQEEQELVQSHTIQKQFFANDKFPMFTFEDKRTFREFGEVIKSKERKVMEKINEDKIENSLIKSKLINHNIFNISENKVDMLLKIKKLDFRKSEFDNKLTKIANVNTNISFFNFFQDIDLLSLEIIIKDINAENVVFVGKEKDNEQVQNAFTNLTNGEMKIEYLSNRNFKNFVIKNEMINIKYDSNVLRNLDCITINNYGSIFKLNKNFLKIKKLRDEEQSFEITILDEKDTEEIKKTNSSRISKYISSTDNDTDNKIITKSKLKITDLKNELSRNLKEDLYIIDNSITNKKQDFKIQTNNNEVVLISSLTPEYYLIRESIYSIYNAQMDFNKS